MRHKLVLTELDKLSDEDWQYVLGIARKHVQIRLNGRTKSGAHGEANLGMSAEDFYVGKAIEKIYSSVWDWQFEKYSISDQVIRIINSMISEVVRKYKDSKEKGSIQIISEEPDFYLFIADLESEINPNDLYDDQVNLIFEAIEGEPSLERILLAILDGLNYDEIKSKMKISKDDIYRAVEKIKTKTKKLIPNKI